MNVAHGELPAAEVHDYESAAQGDGGQKGGWRRGSEAVAHTRGMPPAVR